ncbi:unannotated protein [freshwater metagenome]|uniref:Unannotated protein n=1 Tax=freshwater metagenome TaxID=449393 RepID=A0A6J7EDR9_9ZZZZ|nr:DUF177 domain-containing protein [Actinomycetota bacterium]
MPAKADDVDLGRLQMRAGEGRHLELEVELATLRLGDDDYLPQPRLAPVRVDLSRTTGSGWALRLRFAAQLHGPCMRCLGPAASLVEIDVREIDQPGGGEDLQSPYLEGEVLDLQAWARDSFTLALPAAILCRPDCAGLCPRCGADLNADPEHEHEAAIDPRWAKLGELRFDAD